MRTTFVAAQCEVVWEAVDNTRSGGGEAKSFRTPTECLGQCVDDAACVGADIDYGGGPRCWHYTNSSDFANTIITSGVYHYRLVDRCRNHGRLLARINIT